MAARQPSPESAAGSIMPTVPLRRLLFVAAAAGMIAGLIFTLFQQSLLAPAILRAEALEAGGRAVHDSGMTRMLATAVFNCLAGFGYGLLLAGGMFVCRHGGWRRGLGWGGAGWMSFALAPALGLPPELPGAAEAALAGRQLWWVYAAAGAAVGLTLLVFARGWRWRLAGALLAMAPHLVGAPGPGWHGLPPDAQAFAIGAVAAGATFWLSLGAATGALLTPMRQP